MVTSVAGSPTGAGLRMNLLTDGEDGGVSGDAEADGENNDEDEAGAAGETAQGVSDVAPESVGDGLPACMPDFVSYCFSTAYLCTRGTDSIFGGHATAHLLVDRLAQEAFELLVDLLVACALVAECADAVSCAAQESHRYASRMRLMAAIWRPQFSVSLLRALRPFSVRE